MTVKSNLSIEKGAENVHSFRRRISKNNPYDAPQNRSISTTKSYKLKENMNLMTMSYK